MIKVADKQLLLRLVVCKPLLVFLKTIAQSKLTALKTKPHHALSILLHLLMKQYRQLLQY